MDDSVLLPCEGLPQHVRFLQILQHVRFLQIPSQDFKVIILKKESHAKAQEKQKTERQKNHNTLIALEETMNMQ